jgi:hypothetical protein
MPNYTIDREKFLALMDQFKGDIPFIQMIFNKITSMMPEEYRKQLYADLYHQFVYADDYYVAEHHLFSDDKRYFKTFDELVEFLKSRHIDTETAFKRNKVELALNTPFPISGYKIGHIKKESYDQDQSTRT